MAKIIVTHKSCDFDGITSVWLIKRFINTWTDADVQFVPAGSKLEGNYQKEGDVIEIVNGNEVIHVDTGMGPLDHHQTSDDTVSAASLTLQYVKKMNENDSNLLSSTKMKAVEKIVKVIVSHDHFKEVFYHSADSDIYDFLLFGVLEGLQFQHPGDDPKFLEFGMNSLDALLHTFENKVWAESEMEEKGIEFETKFGKALAVETHNDTVLKLGQKKGYVIMVRKDPTTGSIRIKTRPSQEGEKESIDLTPIYDIVSKRDPQANWFLHVSKKMLLNGSSKNPTMKGSSLPLSEIITILKEQFGR